jgi:preprotein translocase subunit SecE
MANEKDTKVEKAVKPSKEEKAAKKAKIKAAKEAAKNVAQKEGKPKLGLFAKIAKFFRDYNSEFKKLVWPTRQQLAKNSAVVLVSIVVCGTALWAIDFVLGDVLLPALYNLVGLILPM